MIKWDDKLLARPIEFGAIKKLHHEVILDMYNPFIPWVCDYNPDTFFLTLTDFVWDDLEI